MITQKTFAGVNTNVKIGSVTLHVQTESFPLRSMLITHVYLGGTCIHSVKWSYADHVGKRNFEAKLQRAAELQQQNVVKRVPEIWAARNIPEESVSQIRTLPSPAELSESIRDRIDRLYILAMRLRRTHPRAAEMTFCEILSLNPKHQLTLQKLSLLSFAA